MLRAFSQSSENNKSAIAGRLLDCIATSNHLLEVGSGSGQHAMYLAPRLPTINWYPTEMAERLNDLQLNIADAGIANIHTPRVLDVDTANWPAYANQGADVPIDVVYTANTLHIMGWESVVAFFAGVGTVLANSGLVCVYGPFKYAGAFTTASNEAFNTHLVTNNAASGIRDFEAVDALAKEQGMHLLHDFAMPANNQLIVWRR